MTKSLTKTNSNIVPLEGFCLSEIPEENSLTGGLHMRRHFKYGIIIGIFMGALPWILNLLIPVEGLWVIFGIVTNPIGTFFLFFYPEVFAFLGERIFFVLYIPLYIAISIATWIAICYVIQKVLGGSENE